MAKEIEQFLSKNIFFVEWECTTTHERVVDGNVVRVGRRSWVSGNNNVDNSCSSYLLSTASFLFGCLNFLGFSLTIGFRGFDTVSFGGVLAVLVGFINSGKTENE